MLHSDIVAHSVQMGDKDLEEARSLGLLRKANLPDDEEEEIYVMESGYSKNCLGFYSGLVKNALIQVGIRSKIK